VNLLKRICWAFQASCTKNLSLSKSKSLSVTTLFEYEYEYEYEYEHDYEHEQDRRDTTSRGIKSFGYSALLIV